MRGLVSEVLLALVVAGCSGTPGAREELERLCDAAQEVRHEPTAERPRLLRERFGAARSEEMRTFLGRLDETAADEQWALTHRFASQHGRPEWQCPALREIFDASVVPGE